MKKSVLIIASFVLAFVFAFQPVTILANDSIIDMPYESQENTMIPYLLDIFYNDTTIQTSTGRNVVVGVLNISDISHEEQEAAHDDIVETYEEGNVFLISDASYRYNCHSYAWYSQEYSENPYWMYDPSPYFDCLLSYQNTHEESNGNVGDIIVYFNSSGKPIHSGIVVDVLSGTSNGVCGNADLKMVQSKWGDYGLYTHRGDICPYSYSYETTPGDYATSVKYYKLKNHEHNWDTLFLNHTWDQIYCTTCDLKMYHELSYTDIGDNMMHGLSCSFCGVLDTFPHECSSFVNSETEGYHKGVCSVCDSVVYKSHTCTTFVNSSINGYHQGTCTVCNATAYERHEWTKLGNKYRCIICNYITTNISAFDYEGDEVYLQ